MSDNQDRINFNSPIPYYSQLKTILLSKINQKVWNIDDKLPSQSELCDMYQVSRTVVRQALKELEDEGRIEQRKGRVAYVIGPKISGRLLERLSGTYQDMMDLGYIPVSKVLKQHIIQSDEKIARRLQIEAGVNVIEIVRLRFVDGEPFVLVTSYIPYDLCPKIVEIDLKEKSLLDTMKKEYNIIIASSQRSIEAELAKEYEANLLNIKVGAPLLLFNSISYATNGQVVGSTNALFRGDRSRFEVEILTNP
jgi:GntR family transcriptional regulator